MREILFRGKRINDGEWVKGSFCDEIPGEQGGIAQYGSCVFHRVDLTTVGQYTGLTDKNGKKIFEGDIVRTYRNEETFDLMMVEWYEDSAGFVLATQKHFCYYESLTNSHIYLEVIGNIHDNPELLEG